MASCLSVKVHPSKNINEGRKKSNLEVEFEGYWSLHVVTSWLLYQNISISIAMAVLLEYIV